MCTISDKLKLCTCKADDVEILKHYWILKKTVENGIFMMGTIMPPANIGVEIEKYNIETLTKQLNDGNCFDKDVMLILGENYILELHFTCFPELYAENYIVYAFIYKNGKWLETEYDHFGKNLGRKNSKSFQKTEKLMEDKTIEFPSFESPVKACLLYYRIIDITPVFVFIS